MEKPNKHLEWVERITHLMDNQFSIPGTNFRFGLDPILGLVPFLGDAVSFIISGLLVSSLWRYNASGEVKARLLINVFLDFTFGSIPVIGSIFDFFFKANERNLKLIKAHYEEDAYQGDGKRVVLTTLLIIISLVILLVYLVFQLFVWLYHLIVGLF